MKHPIAVTAQFRPFPPNVLPRTPQTTAVELAVDGLALGDEITVNNPANVAENDEHVLCRAVDLSCLRSWRCCALPLRRLLFGIRVVLVDPSLVPSDDLRHEGWVIQGTLMEILTDFGTEFLLSGSQKPGHERCSNVVHVQIRR